MIMEEPCCRRLFRVYAAVVLVGAGFKPAQALAVSTKWRFILRNTLPGAIELPEAIMLPGAIELTQVDLLPSALLIRETLLLRDCFTHSI